MPKTVKIVESTPELKLAEISTDIAKVQKEAGKIEVKNLADYEVASKFLVSTIKPRLNRVKEVMDFFINPYKESRRISLAKMNEIEEMFNEKLKPLQGIESNIKRAMADFKLEEDRKAKAEEDRKEKVRLAANAKREEKGQEPIQTPIATVDRSAATVRTEDGRSTAKKVWKFQIINHKELSQDVLDEVLQIAIDKGIVDTVIRRMVNGGSRSISGCRVYDDYDIGVTAK